MKKLTIRGSEIRLATPLWPATWKIPAAAVTKAQWYQGLVASVPDWLFYIAIGFAIASYVWDPFQKESRLRQAWHWLFDRFEIVNLTVQEPLSAKRDVLSIKLDLRFRRATKGQLWLRVFHCTGMAREPHETVIDLGAVDLPRGGRHTFEVARIAIQHPGLDHTQPQGWAIDYNGGSLVPGSENIAQIELTGVMIGQVSRFLVVHSGHGGGEIRPNLFVIKEDDDIFDGQRNVAK